MTFPRLALGSLLLLAPLLAWAPTAAACAAADLAPGCEVRAGADGVGAEAQLAESDVVVAARPPAGLAPGEPALHVGITRLREPWTDEAALLVRVGCPVEGGGDPCVPDDAFAGASAAQAGQWAGVGTRTEWRSASMWYEGEAAGHTVVVRGNTFSYDQIRRGSIGIWVDGFGMEEYGTFPVPV